jgi:hypothetical protein
MEEHHTHEKKKVHEHHHEKHHPEHHKNSSHGKKPKGNKLDVWKIATLALLLLFVVSIFTSGFSFLKLSSKETVTQETLNFINTNLLQGQAVAELKASAEEDCLYSMELNVAGQELVSYVTKDGKLFFPQALETAAVEAQLAATQQQAQAQQPEITKSDKPKVELFIMSHCPYGTQAEKGIIPTVEALGDNIDFEIKFVDYAMHGEKEVLEQLNQYCIQKEQGDKFFTYLGCFLDKGESESCLTEAAIDSEKLASCTEKADEDFSIRANLEDESSWRSGRFPEFNTHAEDNQKYAVQGSPTLVINGEQVSSARSPAAYLTTICSAFNEAPEECQQELSTETYSPGFGYEAGAASAASCG